MEVKMMNKINISYITDDALETLYKNSEEVAEYLIKEKENSNWLKLIYKGEIFEEKKYKINDIKLLTDENYDNVDFNNSIIIYEAFLHILSVYLSAKQNSFISVLCIEQF